MSRDNEIIAYGLLLPHPVKMTGCLHPNDEPSFCIVPLPGCGFCRVCRTSWLPISFLLQKTLATIRRDSGVHDLFKGLRRGLFSRVSSHTYDGRADIGKTQIHVHDRYDVAMLSNTQR